MAALTAVGGTIGYLRARSIPSLVGGLAVSGLYGTGVCTRFLTARLPMFLTLRVSLQGYLISQNKDGGYTASLGDFIVCDTVGDSED